MALRGAGQWYGGSGAVFEIGDQRFHLAARFGDRSRTVDHVIRQLAFLFEVDLRGDAALGLFARQGAAEGRVGQAGELLFGGTPDDDEAI